jgi:hypothetical protein
VQTPLALAARQPGLLRQLSARLLPSQLWEMRKAKETAKGRHAPAAMDKLMGLVGLTKVKV